MLCPGDFQGNLTALSVQAMTHREERQGRVTPDQELIEGKPCAAARAAAPAACGASQSKVPMRVR